MKKINVVISVVLAITVVGCCIVGVNKSNEAAARTQCVNNLKQIGLSVHGFHDSNRKLPRAIASAPQADFPPEKQISWMWLISPYIEARMDPKFKVDATKPWDDPANSYVVTATYSVFHCPANPNRDTNPNFTHYVGISGVGRNAAWLPVNDAKAGIFGYERTLTLKEIKAADGMATTMMVVETGRDNGPWAMGGFTTVRGIDREEPKYFDVDGQFHSYHRSAWFTSGTTTFVAMADGSVRGLRSSVSDEVIEALATYAGGETIRDADLDR